MRARLFGTREFERLWIAQVVSSTGDWLGFLAVAILATQVGAEASTAVGLVMAARLVPGFFLAPVAGMIVDRLPRQKVMVTCDIGRAAVVATLPFVDSIGQLVLASLALEVLTLLWSPAKEATVPNLVPADRLTSVNSLSMVAAYGTFPVASLLLAFLATVSARLADVPALDALRFDREGGLALAFYVDVCTFLIAAFLVSRLHIPHRTRAEREKAASRRVDWAQAYHEVKEGWQFIFLTPTVRAVNLGLALALIGAGMIVPLGPVFAVEVMGADNPARAFSALITALGLGGALGVVLVNALQNRLPRPQVFTGVLFGAGCALFAAASFSTPLWVSLCIFVMGMCGGSAYVLGFTLLHENVDDALMGRTFGALFTLVRLCILMAFVAGPLLSGFLNGLSEEWLGGEVEIGGLTLAVPGVRLTLWLAGLVVIGAGSIAARSIKSAARVPVVATAELAGAGEAA
jgi:dTMP kinase